MSTYPMQSAGRAGMVARLGKSVRGWTRVLIAAGVGRRTKAVVPYLVPPSVRHRLRNAGISCGLILGHTTHALEESSSTVEDSRCGVSTGPL